MLTGELRGQIDRIWDSFWTGGISNPLEVIEQITYLLFIRRLDDLHTLEERKAARLKRPMAKRFFPDGADARGVPYDSMRWSRFRNAAAGAYRGRHSSSVRNIFRCSISAAENPLTAFRAMATATLASDVLNADRGL